MLHAIQSFCFRYIVGDPVRAAVGKFNCYMRPGGGGCMRGEALTPQEEYTLVGGLLDAIGARPADWEFTHFVARDKRTGMEVWLSNGPAFVSIYEPRKFPLRKGSQKALWRALHDLRHQVRTGDAGNLIDSLNRANGSQKTVGEIKEATNVTTLRPDHHLSVIQD